MRLLRCLVLTVVFALLSATAMAATIGNSQQKLPDQLKTIKLIFPNSDASLELGKDTPVVWSYSGYPETATVRLLLIKNGIVVGEIANNIPIKYALATNNTGALPTKWKVGTYLGGNADPGTDYKIRILVNGFPGQGKSPSTFSIVAPGPAPTLELQTPAGGEILETGENVKIAWNSTGLSGQLRVVLSRAGIDLGTIAKPNATDGSLEWKVGTLLPPDDKKNLDKADYKIRIETPNRSLSAESKNTFIIKPVINSNTQITTKVNPNLNQGALGPKTIEVTYPPTGTTLNRLGEVDIAYRYSDNLKGSYVKLILFKVGTQPGPDSYIILNKHSITSGKSHWNLPGAEALELGSYQIRVQSLDDANAYGDSGIITFTAKERTVTAGYSAKISNHEKYSMHTNNDQALLWDTGSCADLPGTIRVGFRNITKDDNGRNYVYRSFIHFDLKNLKGKVKWAKLSYTKNDGTPDGSRPLFALTLPWNGSASDLFSISGNSINPLDPPQMRALVQGWIDDPNMNFGLVMTGPNESMANNNAGHIMYLANIRLEIGITIID